MANALLRDLGKTALDIVQGGATRAARSVGMIDFPVPPASNMRRTSSSSIKHYVQSGVRTCLPIETAARLNGLDFGPGTAILDFGAGVGRGIKYWHDRHSQAHLFACDVEPSHMDWMANAYPDVDCHANGYMPPLKYGDQQFDLIYSVSIFSHLEEDAAQAWLDEFVRVLKPGGVAALTILGDHALRKGKWKPTPEALQSYEESGLLHFAYPVKESRAVAEKRKFLKYTDYLAHCSDDYGQTYLKPEYIARKWPRDGKLELVGLAQGVIDDVQDLVVLRKPA